MKSLPILLVTVLASGLVGCVQPMDYRDYLAHTPKSILVLPPLNQTAEVTATDAFLSTFSRPLAERGYYVFPPAVIDRFMKENGCTTAGEMHQVSVAKLGEVFGADAVLYVVIKQWETQYILIDSSTKVTLEYRLVDVKTEKPLWHWEQQVVNSSSAGQSNIIGIVVAAAVHKAMSGAFENERTLAIQANTLVATDANHGLLTGPRHPEYEKERTRVFERQKKLEAQTQPAGT